MFFFPGKFKFLDKKNPKKKYMLDFSHDRAFLFVIAT